MCYKVFYCGSTDTEILGVSCFYKRPSQSEVVAGIIEQDMGVQRLARLVYAYAVRYEDDATFEWDVRRKDDGTSEVVDGWDLTVNLSFHLEDPIDIKKHGLYEPVLCAPPTIEMYASERTSVFDDKVALECALETPMSISLFKAINRVELRGFKGGVRKVFASAQASGKIEITATRNNRGAEPLRVEATKASPNEQAVRKDAIGSNPAPGKDDDLVEEVLRAFARVEEAERNWYSVTALIKKLEDETPAVNHHSDVGADSSAHNPKAKNEDTQMADTDEALDAYHKDILKYAVAKAISAAGDKRDAHYRLTWERKKVKKADEQIKEALSGLEDLISRLKPQELDPEIRRKIKSAEEALALKENDTE